MQPPVPVETAADRYAERDRQWSLWMGAAQSGDRTSYERLLRSITPFVRALVRRHCHHRSDIEELVQESLLAMHRVRHTYDVRRPFSPWLAAIATRRSIDWLRKHFRRTRHEIAANPETYETFADPASNKEAEEFCSADELTALLQHLPPRQREALEALKVRELTLVQAASESGQSVAALKVNTHRALKTLRQWWQKHSAGET